MSETLSKRMDETMQAAVAPVKSRPLNAARRLVTEPLVHFVGIGLVLFFSYQALNPLQPAADTNRIELSSEDIGQLAVMWTAKWQRPPTDQELHALVEEHIQEEVLYREALALGLDQDDTIIKRRLAQKMEFLAEDVSNLPEPSTTQLSTWYAANAAKFAEPARLTFEHLYFSPDLRGQKAQQHAVEAFGKLTGSTGTPATAVAADTFIFEKNYADRTPDQIAGIFGTDFATSIAAMPTGAWQGPVKSGLGWHVVRVSSATPGGVPGFAAIEAQVRSEWVGEQREIARRKTFEALRARYEVTVPAGLPIPGKVALAQPSANGDVQ